jgi:hypothetical protein
MFKKLFGRRQKSAPETAPAPVAPVKPFLAVELDMVTGAITAYAHFPQPASEEEAKALAANFGCMTFLLNDGSLLPQLQQAIVVAGISSGLEGVSHMALASLTTLMQGQAQNEEPLIRPTEAFANRNPGGHP